MSVEQCLCHLNFHCASYRICSVYLLGLLGKSSVELNCLPRKEDVKEEQPH